MQFPCVGTGVGHPNHMFKFNSPTPGVYSQEIRHCGGPRILMAYITRLLRPLIRCEHYDRGRPRKILVRVVLIFQMNGKVRSEIESLILLSSSCKPKQLNWLLYIINKIKSIIYLVTLLAYQIRRYLLYMRGSR